MKPPLALLFALALALAGCRPPADQVRMAPGAAFRLCPPEQGPRLQVTQEVTFRLPDGRREVALAVVENGDRGLSLVASTPLGQTLYVVRMRGSQVAVDARMALPAGLDPRLFAALVQFCLWPEAAVRAGLGPGMRLVQAGPVRTLLRDDAVLWRVTRDGDAPPFRTLELESPSLGVSVQVRTLEQP
jgi:hypothetical protein